ncbi:NAD(P)H-hydrate dehydratase [Candidatus Woesearchaeota archaeon]|nr:NAD(P)H-hydrate dehydratase [Candidatus Woesearchaeota archaeon]
MNLKHIKKLMERRKNQKKGEAGYVLIVGGCEDQVGPVSLAALAALRAGCDSVTIAAPEKVAWAVNTLIPDINTKKFPGKYFTLKHAKEIAKLSDKFDVVLIGNGLGPQAANFCKALIRKVHKPKVLDSDALKVISFKEMDNSILTATYSEMEKLLLNSQKEFLLPRLTDTNPKELGDMLQGNLKFFLNNGNVLLIKGPTDIIISLNKVTLNKSGNPGMAKAGTGDVLAGLCAGFYAQTKDAFKSAMASSFVNGKLADLLLKRKGGYSFISSDILEDFQKLKGKKIIK